MQGVEKSTPGLSVMEQTVDGLAGSAVAEGPKDSDLRVEEPVQEASVVGQTVEFQLRQAQQESSAEIGVELSAEPTVEQETAMQEAD